MWDMAWKSEIESVYPEDHSEESRPKAAVYFKYE